MRACHDPADRDKLQALRNESGDFQAAVNGFAMFKARQTSERYVMTEEVRVREWGKIVAKGREGEGEGKGEIFGGGGGDEEDEGGDEEEDEEEGEGGG